MTAARHAVIIITANSNFAKLVLPCLTGLAIGMTTNLADIAPIFPVFRPSLCRFLPGMRSIHPR